jgi:DNA-binding transcriptional regulator LsrR (DeoR family)
MDLIGKAARLHYEFGLTHQETAEILRISRVKVTRLLAQAREAGIVQITINSDASPYAALEHELVQRFGLEEAMVVPRFDDEAAQRRAVARGVATYLQRVLRDGMSVTIGFSRTLALVPDFVVAPPRVNATFVPLVGGLGRTSDAVNAHESTERLAQLFGGRAEHLHAPAVMGSAEVAAALRSEPAIARALDRAAHADAALVGLGGLRTASATLLEAGDITRRELKQLAAAGAVGDIAARFFDAGGQSIELELGQRLIGLALQEIRAIPVRLIAAAGSEKVVALRAALTAGMATVLVTDAATVNGL